MSHAVAERYLEIADRVAEAARRSGRTPQAVRIVAVTKTVEVERIRIAVEAGARDLGENYVQEARSKRRELDRPDLAWHMIGRLQRNKAKEAAELFDVVHSLDRGPLARALDRACSDRPSPFPCLVEVNVGHEATKAGVAESELEPFLREVSGLTALSIEGLMAIPPAGAGADGARRHFARLRALRERLGDLRLQNVRLKELSMGMSADYAEAVEEGATIVRIGTAIFGPRTRRA